MESLGREDNNKVQETAQNNFHLCLFDFSKGNLFGYSDYVSLTTEVKDFWEWLVSVSHYDNNIRRLLLLIERILSWLHMTWGIIIWLRSTSEMKRVGVKEKFIHDEQVEVLVLV